MKKAFLLCISVMLTLTSYASEASCEAQQSGNDDLTTVLESVIQQYEGTGSSILIGIKTGTDADDVTLEYVEEIPTTESDDNISYKPAGNWTLLGTVKGPFGLNDIKNKVTKLLNSKVSYEFYIEHVNSYTYNIYYRRA